MIQEMHSKILFNPWSWSFFAPKHLRFWSNKYPILDTRISLILCGNTNLLKINKNNVSKYDDFISLINILAEQFKTKSILDVEKALFAFSKTFLNDKLTLNKNIEDKTDIEIENYQLTILDEKLL